MKGTVVVRGTMTTERVGARHARRPSGVAVRVAGAVMYRGHRGLLLVMMVVVVVAAGQGRGVA